MMNGEVVGRVDLKADRVNGALLVHGAYAEAGIAPARIANSLADELLLMAAWLDLTDVVVARRGNLSAALRSAMKIGTKVR